MPLKLRECQSKTRNFRALHQNFDVHLPFFPLVSQGASTYNNEVIRISHYVGGTMIFRQKVTLWTLFSYRDISVISVKHCTTAILYGLHNVKNKNDCTQLAFIMSKETQSKWLTLTPCFDCKVDKMAHAANWPQYKPTCPDTQGEIHACICARDAAHRLSRTLRSR